MSSWFYTLHYSKVMSFSELIRLLAIQLFALKFLIKWECVCQDRVCQVFISHHSIQEQTSPCGYLDYLCSEWPENLLCRDLCGSGGIKGQREEELTLSEREALLFDQTAVVPGWVHTPHLVQTGIWKQFTICGTMLAHFPAASYICWISISNMPYFLATFI